MKTLRIIWPFLILILILNGCSDGTGPDEAVEDRFPLQVDNWWVYGLHTSNGFYQWVTRVTDEAVINGQTYFVLTGAFYAPMDNEGKTYLRQGNDGRIFVLYDGQEYIFADFALESWPTYDGRIVTRTSLDETLAAPAGTFNDMQRLLYDNPEYDDEEVTLDFASGVGVVQVTSMIGMIKLESAQVDGHEFPD